MNTKLISLRDFSLSYNLIFKNDFVPRNHFIDEVEELANGDNKLILIEGNEGIGKTNFLLQFATRHCFDSFTYFINPACKFTAKHDFLMEDLGKQIAFYLNSESDTSTIDQSVFNTLLFNLLRSPIKKGKRIYFIIDGLDQIEKSEVELLKPILEMLPWGTNNFTFIISGNSENLSAILPEQVFKKSKTFRVIRFSYEDTCKFFSWGDNADTREVHETWGGNPERLGQVKRLLSNGIEIKEFLARDDIREKNDLLEIEWKQSGIDALNFNSEILKLICILAFDDNIRSLLKIIGILTSDDANFKNEIENISFLAIKDDDISFVSKAYKHFAINKFKKYEKKTFALLISYYAGQDDISSVMNLPSLYDKNQDWKSIVDLLTVNNLDLIVSESNSFADIKRQLNIGYKASRSLNKAYEELFRFSLYRSLINGLQRNDIRETQIRAYVALRRLDDALSLINKAILKEDKLKMMLKYATECKIRKLLLDPILLKDIEELVTEIDNEFLIQNLVDISVGLAQILPNVAITIIEKAAGLKTHGGSLEWLFGFIAYIISKNKQSGGNDDIKVSNLPNSSLSDTFIDKFTKSIGFGINDITENEIIERVSNIENVSDKLYFTKSWILKNYDSPNILEIIDFAINLLLESSSTVMPTASTLLDLAYPLPFLKEYESILNLIKRLDELMTSINTPTNDKIRLQLLIIESMIKYDMVSANQRIVDVYDFVQNLSEHSTRIEAYSDCWKLVKKINNSDNITASEFLLDENDVKKEIQNDIDTFLKNVASQFDELEKTFETIAKIDFDYALHLISKMNNSSTRAEALCKIIEVYGDQDINFWDVKKIKLGLSLIDINSYYVIALMSVFESAEKQIEKCINFKDKIVEIVPLINFETDFRIKCQLLSIAIRILIKPSTDFSGLQPKYDKLVVKLKEFLKIFWNKIDDPVLKITTGYTLTSSFIDFDKSVSEDFFKSTEELASEHIIDNLTHANIFIESIRIMIRIFAGINIKKRDFPYSKIESLIDYIPSNMDKASLWAELAVRVRLSGNIILADEIVSKKITAIVDRYKSDTDPYHFYNVLNICASAIHLSQPEALRLLIDKTPTHIKEKIISSVCFVSLTKHHESEPFNDIKGSTDFKYQDTIEFINLIDFLETDYEIYHNIKNLCNVAKFYPNNFTREQKIEIKRRLEKLVNEKLPNIKTGVKHNGYLIACKACILNFSTNNPNDRLSDFEKLGSDVLSITNTADRTIVYTILAKECPIKKKTLEFLNITFNEADQVLSIKEKINLYENALSETSSYSTDLFQSKLSKIQSEITKLDENDKYPSYRKFIDLAYKHDKLLAKRLIALVDNDPGRKQLLEPINEHYDKLELEKNVLEDYSQIGKIKSRKTMGDIVYKMLGEINSNKRKSRTLEQTVHLLYTTSKLPFFQSIPLIEFFIQNYIHNNTNNDNLLISFYDAAYSNSKLCYNLICNISNKNRNTIQHTSLDSETTFVARFGMRNQAMEFLERNIKQVDSNDIVIIDPYFSSVDIPFIKSIFSWLENPNISVLTSCEAQREFSKFSFKSAWNEISTDDFPNSLFVSASNSDKKSPFHDRWILFLDKKKGIRLGTSINAIGGKKISELSTISLSEVDQINENIVIPLLNHRIRDFNGQSIKYETCEF